MLKIIKETHNGIEECLIIDSDNNKKILEKTNGVLYNGPIYIVKRRLNDYVESDKEKDSVEEIQDVEDLQNVPRETFSSNT